MKTALELLGDDRCEREECGSPYKDVFCPHELMTVARRAREEAFEMAAKVARGNACEMECDHHLCAAEVAIEARIRALPTEPKP